MSFHKLIAFDRPLSGATIPGHSARLFSESEMAVIRTKAYQDGGDAARAFASQQLVEFRAEVQALQEGLFEKLAATEADMLAQLRETLPSLTIDLARRLLAGFEPSAEHVQRLCEETLAQLYPEKENLELVLSPKDAAQLDQLAPTWKSRFPGLKIVSDSSFVPGDCQVRSRFGVTDARSQVKLEALSRELQNA